MPKLKGTKIASDKKSAEIRRNTLSKTPSKTPSKNTRSYNKSGVGLEIDTENK